VQDIAERLGRYLAEAAPAALEACP
jgi:hypothetical protein